MSLKCIVITVNYCCAEEILKGMDATMREVFDVGEAAFWIVDNKSPDNSIATLNAGIADKPYRDHIRILENDCNGGFGSGNNFAIQEALVCDEPPASFYILNPDATPKPGALRHMLEFLNTHPEVGAAGGLLCNEDDKIESSMFRFPSFQSEIEEAVSIGFLRKVLKKYVLPIEPQDQPIAVDWVAGTSFVVRREALEKSGLFDENFFLYWEEIELCHRIRAVGYEIYGLPGATVMHIGGVSTGMHNPTKRIPPYWYASRNYFFRATGRVQSITLLNIAVAFGLVARRTHQFLRRKPMNTPHFLRDFIVQNFFSNKGELDAKPGKTT